MEEMLDKKFGAMSLKDYTERIRELVDWANGFLTMIIPTLSEDEKRVAICLFGISDVATWPLRDRVRNIMKRDIDEMQTMTAQNKANERTINDMLRNNGIGKES